jgi:hypothetical protein
MLLVCIIILFSDGDMKCVGMQVLYMDKDAEKEVNLRHQFV